MRIRQTEDYMIVTGSTRKQLTARVKKVLKPQEGWWVQGGMFVLDEKGKRLYLQTMAKVFEGEK